jgi:hypothetical protein
MRIHLVKLASFASEDNPIDIVIVTTGILHDKDIMTKKSIKDLSASLSTKLSSRNCKNPAIYRQNSIAHSYQCEFQ